MWRAYYVEPASEQQSRPGGGPPTPERKGSVDALRQGTASRYEVSHAAPVYLIDRKGMRRVLFTPPLDPTELVHDIRVLLE